MANPDPLARHPYPPALIDAEAVGYLLGVSADTVWRDLAAGRLPPPVQRGHGRTRWRYQELVDWVNAGMPDPAVWEWEPHGNASSQPR